MQPDFTELFFQVFRGKPRPITYEIRHGRYLLHDLAFISSLVHDARLKRSTLVQTNEMIVVPLVRDCWELRPWGPYRQPSDGKGTFEESELPWVRSELQIRGAGRPRWSCRHRSTKRELWISYVWASEECRGDEKFDLILTNALDWRLTIPIRAEEWRIILVDRELPNERSSRPV